MVSGLVAAHHPQLCTPFELTLPAHSIIAVAARRQQSLTEVPNRVAKRTTRRRRLQLLMLCAIVAAETLKPE